MPPAMHATLVYLRLVDRHDGTLSLTSVGLIAALGVFGLTSSWPALVLVGLFVGLHAHRRHLGHSRERRERDWVELTARLAAVETASSKQSKDMIRLANKAGVSL